MVADDHDQGYRCETANRTSGKVGIKMQCSVTIKQPILRDQKVEPTTTIVLSLNILTEKKNRERQTTHNTPVSMSMCFLGDPPPDPRFLASLGTLPLAQLHNCLD